MRRRALWGLAAVLVAVAGCETSTVTGPRGGSDAVPAAPRNLDARYYARAVSVTWELAPAWDGESFRVYARRTSDPDYFLIAEVTNCSEGLCSYTDVNIVEGVTYEYYVAAVSPSGAIETASEFSVTVPIPSMTPPPVPTGMEVVALDGAAYLRWEVGARDADDFSFYRVYLEDGEGSAFLLGETDSEGFLDELAQNGATYRYFVSAVDDQGHESGGSAAAEGTPRPDFHNEYLWDYFDRPELAGFRFQDDEATDPVVDGDDPSRHLRLESDAQGWWLVPGPGVEIDPLGFETTALKCGPGADAGCVALEVAPSGGYGTADVNLLPQTTYALRIPVPGGGYRYAALRVTLLGVDQNGDGIMIFDWSYQLQVGNPNLAPHTRVPGRTR
jgi:hypothetical protein